MMAQSDFVSGAINAALYVNDRFSRCMAMRWSSRW